MKLVRNILSNESAQVEGYHVQSRGKLEEASFEHCVETSMVLSKLFLGMNLFKDDDVIKEGFVVKMWSMGPMFQQQQPIMSQNPNINKTWPISHTIKPLPVIIDV
jgi:hypothetical protein